MPFSVLRAVAWIVFVEMAAMVVFGWYEFMSDRLEPLLPIAFTGAAVACWPMLPSAGWGVFKGGNICRNTPTYIVAVLVHLTFAGGYWTYALDDAKFDEIFALGLTVTSLILVRAYSDYKKQFMS
ncbi:hypothetical protein [Phaeocystidibacter luteus]|uniref:hypothetical protein n=1 Tax=Phaeocystidibacter luteus TaxID=911197 RepID=UPI00124C3BEB|nr:hypothetical protein [Phaeocystidibacter luteus]